MPRGNWQMCKTVAPMTRSALVKNKCLLWSNISRKLEVVAMKSCNWRRSMMHQAISKILWFKNAFSISEVQTFSPRELKRTIQSCRWYCDREVCSRKHITFLSAMKNCKEIFLLLLFLFIFFNSKLKPLENCCKRC